MPSTLKAIATGSVEDTKARLIEAAVKLFADRGFDAVSLSDITKAAKANIAAVNYHFGSKEQLIREAFHAVATPFNTHRLAALDRYEADPGPNGFDAEGVVRVYVNSAIDLTRRGQGLGRYYNRFAFLFYALRQPFVDDILANETDRVALRFIDALSRAMPHLARGDIIWRHHFMAGSTIYILLDSERFHRVRRLSKGACQTSDPNEIAAQLVRFVMGGIGA
jgi:AcrR family transcriptional regulator